MSGVADGVEPDDDLGFGPGDSIVYLFALRDQMPLPPEGWTLSVHTPECTDEHCAAVSARLFSVGEEVDDGMVRSVQNLMDALAHLNDAPPPNAPPANAQLPVGRWVAAAGKVAPGDWPASAPRHFEECFAVLHDAVASLRVATGALLPDLTIERVWPMYLICRLVDGSLNPERLVLIEHGQFGPLQPATAEQLTRAEALFAARRSRDPIELYRDFRSAALVAAYRDGDYSEAVLKAAVASEVLIKHTAWLLSWEASMQVVDPHPAAGTDGLGDKKPRQLISQVLQPRLGGSWESSSLNGAIGAWRFNIAQLRNAIIHRGHRPSEDEAKEAVASLAPLATHMADRVANRAAVYPRTALIAVGEAKLAERGAFVAAQSAAGDVDRTELLSAYADFVDALGGVAD